MATSSENHGNNMGGCLCGAVRYEHVWISQISDYYKLDDDLPKFEKGWESK